MGEISGIGFSEGFIAFLCHQFALGHPFTMGDLWRWLLTFQKYIILHVQFQLLAPEIFFLISKISTVDDSTFSVHYREEFEQEVAALGFNYNSQSRPIVEYQMSCNWVCWILINFSVVYLELMLLNEALKHRNYFAEDTYQTPIYLI